MNNKRVLIVDDDPDILEALNLVFEGEGYETQSLTQGEQTLRLASEFNPSVIILDVLLSGSDGRIICKNLKTANETKNIPVIMISAHPDAASSSIQVGADDFVAKPFDIYQLIGKVERHLNEKLN